MTRKDKDIVLKDICCRLPYGVKCYIPEANVIRILGSVQEDGENTLFDFWEDEEKIQYGFQLYISEFKPYLFPLSSLTEEQQTELFDEVVELEFKAINDEIDHTDALMFEIDWYLKNHIDYRGLIDKGLAIDATGKNIY